MPNNTDKSIEQWLWDAARSIRGVKDALKYKDFILLLVFAAGKRMDKILLLAYPQTKFQP